MVRVGRRGSLNGSRAHPRNSGTRRLSRKSAQSDSPRGACDGRTRDATLGRRQRLLPRHHLSDLQRARRHRRDERRSGQRSSCCSTSASTPNRRRNDCKRRSRRCSPGTASTRMWSGHSRVCRFSPNAAAWSTPCARSIREATGADPELSTGGGTSDGRFIAPTGTEVIEVGVVNETIHSVDECVAVADVATPGRYLRRERCAGC